jgi:ABC-type sugar transport system substrate-binding protein
MNKIRLLIILPLIAILLAGCSSDNSYRWHVGVSQCVGGKWREKANREMITAQHLSNHEVKVDIVSADNDSRRQVRQIDSLVAAGVDLLVISPNEQSTVSPAIERAR